ncbi:Protein kinase domain protein [Chitinispirillum alkaliphilum]|nr:Protein kinase domain protein [Chitinispirillum alkaliphilum]
MTKSEKKSKAKKKFAFVMLVIFVLILIALYLYSHYTAVSDYPPSGPYSGADSQDTVSLIDSIPEIIEEPAEEEEEEEEQTVPAVDEPAATEDKPKIPQVRDTVEETAIDTSYVIDDQPEDPCAEDTLGLWVYPDPSGGLHYGSVNVSLVANKECSISWRWAGESEWRSYEEEPIKISASKTLVYRAVDLCGNEMEPRRAFYEIRPSYHLEMCPEDMVYVKSGEKKFCIDRYAWPNRSGVRPTTFISLYEAMDSCFAAGKRLPTKQEWSTACSGPNEWLYPYGSEYEKYACATYEQEKPFLGEKPECRSYFGVYDMSGGVAEWTSTVSEQNRNFFNVMGGFWESGSQSGCFDARYSYFPQNRHNPVGFRCVKDIENRSENDEKHKENKK